MILVWGSVSIADGNLAEALQLSLEHVDRSRREPGCRSHNVSIDAEDETRLTFHEEWEDLAALHQHFEVEESVKFARRLTELAADQPEVRIYEALRVK